MHILLPLDGSLRAETVLHPLAVLARRATTPPCITLLAVLERDADERHIQAYLAAMQHHLDLAALTVQTQSVVGDPAEGICRTAHEVATDLIMMASHMTMLDPVTGASVAETVARCAATPTLVIRPEGIPFSDVPRYQPLTLAVVIDPLSSPETYQPCARFAMMFDAEVLLVAEQGPTDENDYQALTRLARHMGSQGIAVSRLLAPSPLSQHLAQGLQSGHLALLALPLTPAMNTKQEVLLRDVTAPTLLFHAVPSANS